MVLGRQYMQELPNWNMVSGWCNDMQSLSCRAICPEPFVVQILHERDIFFGIGRFVHSVSKWLRFWHWRKTMPSLQSRTILRCVTQLLHKMPSIILLSSTRYSMCEMPIRRIFWLRGNCLSEVSTGNESEGRPNRM